MHYLTHHIMLGAENHTLRCLTLHAYNIKILNSSSRSQTPTYQDETEVDTMLSNTVKPGKV